MTSGHFDETDLKSYYHQHLTLEDAKGILIEEDQGVFLVRDSQRGGYVVCVKEEKEVTQYPVKESTGAGQRSLFVREECPFKDLPSLISFYKHNLFKSTALIRPVNRDRVLLHRLRNAPVGADRHTLIEDVTMAEYPSSSEGSRSRISAPPGMAGILRPPSGRANEDGPPVYAKVIKMRTPSPYETSALTLKVGDILRVTKRKDGQGQGELLTTGKTGNFPLAHVELIGHSTDLAQSPVSPHF